MRVLVVTNLYPPDVLGGYELLARDVVRDLRERGHEVDVLTSGSARPEDHDDGVWRTLRLIRPFGEPLARSRARAFVTDAFNARRARRYLAERGRPAAVLVMSQRRLGLGALRVFQDAGSPLVATVNDDWPLAYCREKSAGVRARIGAALDATLFRRTTFDGLPFARALYLSRGLRDATSAAAAPLPPGKVQPQGVDRRVFEARAARPFGSPVRLLFVGRLHPSKAPDVAIDAAALLRRQGIDVELTIAGAPHSEEYGRELVARGAGRGVRWLGAVKREDLPELYRSADVFVFTCRFALEGQGLTYLEAMSCGVPVVAAPAGGAKELLEGTGAAVLASACEGPAVAEAIRTLVTSPSSFRDDLRASAFALLDEKASLDRYVDVVEAELTAAAA